MNILNLYSGLGGNRKLWDKKHKVTAIEYNPEIAKIYQDFYPDDKVIVTDAHQYLLEHYNEYDFIWSSPPCPSHSDIRRMGVDIGQNKALYPDMSLYQEIILLENFCKFKWAVENVIPYYEPLMKPTIILDRHLIWSNFIINKKEFKSDTVIKDVKSTSIVYGFDISKYKINHRKDQLLRNLINPEIGLYIFNSAFKNIQLNLFDK